MIPQYCFSGDARPIPASPDEPDNDWWGRLVGGFWWGGMR
jgi:hypothetical protein